jgi:hypothetical protein
MDPPIAEHKEHNMKEFVSHSARAVRIWLGCLVGCGMFGMVSTGWAKEIVFVARDVEYQQAVWLPLEVVLHQSTDFTEPLILRLSNPTERTHVFEAPGLFESVDESGVQITRPVRVTIAPEGTEQIVIDRNRMSSDVVTAESETMTYRFYCPLHRADDDLGGKIIVRQ